MDALYGVRFVGPLAPFSRGFAEELARLGFTTFSARGQLGLAAHLSRWLAEAGLGAGALTAPVAEAFVSARRVLGYTAYLTPKALRPLLDYLQGLGVTQRQSGWRPRRWWRNCWSGIAATFLWSGGWESRWPTAMSMPCVGSSRAA